jgi:hypothetical protein
MPLGTDSVNLSGIPNRICSQSRGRTQLCAGLSELEAIPLPFEVRPSRKSGAKSERLTEWLSAKFRNSGKRFADRGSCFSTSAARRGGWQFPFPTFVPRCGIFPHTRSHLTNLGAVARIAGGGRDPFLRLKSGSGQDDAHSRRSKSEGRLDLSILQMFK